MSKPKLLILQNEISSYSVPVYNCISDFYELTVGYYTNDKSKEVCKFKKHYLETKYLGSLIFVKDLGKLVKEFDIVSIIPDMHVVSYCLLPFLPRKFKVVNWSIGFRVSYSHPYITNRRHTLFDLVFKTILSHCDASIFYMEKSKEFWAKTNLDMQKVFIAPNTTEVMRCSIDPMRKHHFLFVGTLYKGKGLDLLLKAYLEAVRNVGIDNELHIVGDGDERQSIESFIIHNNLKDRVFLHGAIYDEKTLSQLFLESLLCISPTQGGLSVPKSMGYGVPFVTKTSAITGGEIYHIKHEKNGLLYSRDEELIDIMVDAYNNPEKYIKMGAVAKKYYENNATIKHMASGAMQAYRYALMH